MKKGHEILEVDGIEIEVSNRDKLIFPYDGITKGDLIAYYEKISPVILPYLKNRLLTMVRYPAGILEEGFFQKDIAGYFPDWIDRARVEKQNGSVTHVVCNNTATLVYIANLACISTHVTLSRIDSLHHPDQLIFDLDLDGGDFGLIRSAAIKLRALLAEIGLEAFLKTTGSSGLHVLVPLDRSSDFEAVRTFARSVAVRLSEKFPRELTVEQRKEKRAGRVYLDVMRNSYGQTAASAYSVRARPGAPVSAPIDWEELDDGKLDSRRFNIRNIFGRLENRGDPWEAARDVKFSLENPRVRLAEII